MGDKALLFLDIDGVINGDSRRFSEHHRVHLSAEEMERSKSPFTHKFDDEGLTLRVSLDPRIREWVHELSEYFELVWASTWEHSANVHISPLLGLGEIGVVEHSKILPTFGEVKNHEVARWKWRGIVPYASDRSLAFVDDQAGPLIQLLRAQREHEGRPKSSSPFILAPRYGLDGTDMEHLLTFGASHLA